MSSLVAMSCGLFCEARTYQNKITTIQSDKTKSDEMKIVFNCSTGVDGKEGQAIETVTFGCDQWDKNDLKLGWLTGPVKYGNLWPELDQQSQKRCRASGPVVMSRPGGNMSL